MSTVSRCLVVTYHSISFGRPPLQLDPPLFERHVEGLAAAGATSLTVSELAAALRAGSLPQRAVAITFDDGFADVSAHALPVLERHGLRATVFAISGWLGRASDWPTQPPRAPRLPLLDADGLRQLVAHGWEVGAHGVDHRPLAGVTAVELGDQLRRSRAELAAAAGTEVTSFAFPYGSVPTASRSALVDAGLTAACVGRLDLVAASDDPLALPRVDAHYLRDPGRLVRAATGEGTRYLAARRRAARLRRLLVADHGPAR